MAGTTTFNKDLDVLGTIDLNKNQMIQMVLEVLASAPGAPVEGQMYYNSVDETAYIRTSAAWLDLGELGVSDGDKGDITVTGTGATWTIDASVVTYAKIQKVAANNVLLGNDNGTTQDVQELTATEVRAILNVEDGSNNYTHPNHTGDVTSVADGAQTIAADAVTYAKMQNVVANNVLLGNTAGAGGIVDELTKSEVLSLLNVEDGADVTDATNVNAAGAVMETDISATPSGRIIDDDTMATASNTTLATSESIKAYVDGAVTGGMIYRGGYNASTNTPALDTGSPVLQKGDTYTVTAAGTFFTIEVEIGDVLIAEVDSVDAAAEADWTVLQKNLDGAVIGPASAVADNVVLFDGTSGKLIKDSGVAISGSNTGDEVNASTTVKGIAEEATQTEVNSATGAGGTGARLFVNPSTLATSKYTQKYAATFGNGSLVTFTFAQATHGLKFNPSDYAISVKIVSTGVDVECQITTDDATGLVTVDVNTAPASNAYKIVIIG